VSARTRTHAFAGNTAIVGIGATEFSKESRRSELRLAVEAVDLALRDAGIEPSEVGGLVTFSSDTNPEIDIARSLGMGELSFFSRIHYGGGAGCATIQQAAMAVQAGVADVVVCYRAFNERSGDRFGTGVQDRPPAANAEASHFSWYSPLGLLTPAQWVAMAAQRYLHVSGATSEDLGRVAVADRRHAATNPKAWFYGKPITLAEHQASRWIVEPLHLLDCCQETDGGQALVVTSVERARDLPGVPVVIEAAAQGSGKGQEMMTSYYADDLCGLPEMAVVARQLWETSGLSPADIQTAVLYDHFTPYVLYQLEELGFCGKAEAKDFVRDGNIELGGGLPINTHGGQLGEAYLHGMNGIAEGVRQVRGSSVNQVEGVEHVLVTAGTGVPTSGLILGVDR
jgi:acetyl-CoA acetyltransferase